MLRLVADGHDTAEILRLSCATASAPPTVCCTIDHPPPLRNRSHAVAYALREGLI